MGVVERERRERRDRETERQMRDKVGGMVVEL